jgi:glyoxylase-like metal-dependent hydrolase (beta-lactamase superfamily II)
MKTSSHGDHLTKITKGGFVNSYLVREDDGLTLVDTMLPKSEKGILAAARSLGQPIVRIALTHAHQDHVGSVDALKAALPDAEVLISQRDARFLTGDKSLEPAEAENGKARGSFVKIETTPTRLLQPGDRVGSLEVVASPGHTPGHVAFLDTRDRTLIAGDSWVTLGGVSVPSRASWRFPLVWFGTGNRPQALESAKALRALDASRLAVGHGRVIESPGAEMDKAIAKAS